jgi:hypothetical protein
MGRLDIVIILLSLNSCSSYPGDGCCVTLQPSGGVVNNIFKNFGMFWTEIPARCWFYGGHTTPYYKSDQKQMFLWFDLDENHWVVSREPCGSVSPYAISEVCETGDCRLDEMKDWKLYNYSGYIDNGSLSCLPCSCPDYNLSCLDGPSFLAQLVMS